MTHDDVHAVRLPVATWNAACVAAGGEGDALTSVGWGSLVDAGIATAPGTLDERWAGLLETYLRTPSSVRIAASYRGLLYRSALALGPASICVLERFQTERQPDGSLTTTAHDDLLEVAVTQGHPWALLRRVLPPLGSVQAPAQQTAPANARPVGLDGAALQRLSDAVATDPHLDVSEFLKSHSTDGVRDLLNSDDASISYLFATKVNEDLVLGLEWYVASEERLFRARLSGDPPWEQVRPGDVAFTFDWHLLGALDALGVPAP